MGSQCFGCQATSNKLMHANTFVGRCLATKVVDETLCRIVHIDLTGLSSDKQYEAMEELMEDVPPQNKLLLSWLLTHMTHVIEKV